MLLSPEAKNLLLHAAKTFGFHLMDEVDKFDRFYDLLLAANRQTNLTSITDEKDIVLKHFVDSLSCVSGGYLEGTLEAIDVGTGAGFPGIPLLIAKPSLKVTLMDATRKKTVFTESVIEALRLKNARVLWGRAEEVSQEPQHREAYERVVTRAVSALGTLYELCLPFIKVGGYLIAQKGPEALREVQEAALAAEKLGGQLAEVIPLKLPVTGDSRNLVIVAKTAPTPDKYPRPPGIPQKNPLS